MNVAGFMSVARVLVATIALAGTTLATEALAQAAGSAPAADTSSAGAASRRFVARDIEPVYRGGTIDTLATIRKRGVLRVGVALSEPTVMHDADGKLVGFSIDAARRLADDLGVGLEFVETSWSGIIPDLLNREFDLIMSGLWVTVPRALVINFTTPTAVEGIHVIAGRDAAARLKTPADLDQAGTKIVVYAGTLQERLAARRFPKATLVKVSGDADHLAPVLAGEADMVVGSRLHPDARSDFDLLNRWGNRCFVVLAKLLLGVACTDLLSGYRAFTRGVVQCVPIESEGFEVDTELTVRAIRARLRVVERPVGLARRPPGSRSKLRPVRDGLAILRLMLALRRDDGLRRG